MLVTISIALDLRSSSAILELSLVLPKPHSHAKLGCQPRRPNNIVLADLFTSRFPKPSIESYAVDL